MAIIRKRNTTLAEQQYELRTSIEENNKKLISETKILESNRELYVKQYTNEINSIKKRNIIPIYIFSLIISMSSSTFLYKFYNSKLIALIVGIYIFLLAKKAFLFKVLYKIKQDKELGNVQNKLLTIQNKHNNINDVLKEKLNKIKKGLDGENTVSSLIEKELSDKFTLLNDITIPTPDGSGTTQIDHVLITPKRVICLETKSSEGIYYSDKSKWIWYPSERKRYGKTVKGCPQDKNPINQATYHSRKLYNILISKGIKCKVDAAIVLSNPNSEYGGTQEKFCPVLPINQLIAYLKLDDIEKIIINKNIINKISEILLQCDEKFSRQHYGKYDKGILSNEDIPRFV